MKLIILAFFISLIIHFFIFIEYKPLNHQNNIERKETKQKKSNIKYVKLEKIKPKIKKKPQVKKKTINKTVKKPINTKKIKKKTVKPKVKNKKKTTKKTQNKVHKKQVVKNKQTIQKKTLESFLSQKSLVNPKILSDLQRLYGREFETFTKVQKAFLKKHLNSFRQITQRVLNRLGYPPLAVKLRLSGTNIVEFSFHPNGDISNLRISNGSGYEIFDKYTLELIKIAYKEYPKPKEITKIKFNVRYRIIY